jgi:hypothetical protein
VNRTTALATALATAAVTLLGATAANAVPVAAGTAQGTPTFRGLNDAADPTFNQLLGINNNGVIAGYFGSGVANHPNKGYTLTQPYGQGQYVNENFPGSAQTQVIGINNANVTVGFFVDASGATFGFVKRGDRYTKVANPNAAGTTLVTQLLGVNDEGIAAGFYNDATGTAHGFTYDIARRSFHAVRLPSSAGAGAVTVTGINNRGDLSGFYTAGTTTFAFEIVRGHFRQLSFGGGSNTQALGINSKDQVVGSYVDASGLTHGFAWSQNTLTTIDEPFALPVVGGGTVVNGLNDSGQLVGFFMDKAGNTEGMLVQNAI